MLDGTQFSDPEIKNAIRTGNFHIYILFPVTRKKSSIVPKLKKATTDETEEAPILPSNQRTLRIFTITSKVIQ